MGALRNLEGRLAGLVEGTFSRVFRSPVRPAEIARKLMREMDEHKTVSVSRTYAPNEFVVWLCPQDRERFGGMEHDIQGELVGSLLEHARRENLALVTRPRVTFQSDERLNVGEFGIQTRMVQPGDEAGEPVEQGKHGHTMVYSNAERLREPLDERGQVRAPMQQPAQGPMQPPAQGPMQPPAQVPMQAPMQAPAQPPPRPATAIVNIAGSRMVVGANGAVLGRSRDCEITVDDPNVSRRHAEIKPSGGSWVIRDMGSTNGVLVNGQRVDAPKVLRAGDRIEMGTSTMSFQLEA